MIRRLIFALAILVSACRDQRPPAPTAEQNRQLNEAEQLLNEQAEAKVTHPQ